MPKRKKGEREAITILEHLGIEIDKNYYDDNSQQSMPDIRCKDGQYIEVTHTFHNNAIPTRISKADIIRQGEGWKDHTERLLTQEIKCGEALERISKLDYDQDEKGNLTPTGRAEYMADAKLVKEHLGYDVLESDLTKQHSEFKCDHPSIIHSVDSILREITEDKAAKYPDSKTDLFVFATEEEFRLMKRLIKQANRNVHAIGFIHQMLQSPFPKIYVCEWDFIRQKYDTVNPQLIIFYKHDGGLKWKSHNLRSTEETEMET